LTFSLPKDCLVRYALTAHSPAWQASLRPPGKQTR
jgi:hypothetical protein